DGIRDFHVTGVQTCALPILKFGPELEVMPGEADVLAQNALVVIADITAIRQRPHRFGPEIRAIARGEPEVPHLIWPKSDARADRSEERRVGKECRSRRWTEE